MVAQECRRRCELCHRAQTSAYELRWEVDVDIMRPTVDVVMMLTIVLMSIGLSPQREGKQYCTALCRPVLTFLKRRRLLPAWRFLPGNPPDEGPLPFDSKVPPPENPVDPLLRTRGVCPLPFHESTRRPSHLLLSGFAPLQHYRRRALAIVSLRPNVLLRGPGAARPARLLQPSMAPSATALSIRPFHPPFHFSTLR